MWEYVGMARNEEGLKLAIKEIQKLREDFYKDLRITGDYNAMNIELEKSWSCRRFHRFR